MRSRLEGWPGPHGSRRALSRPPHHEDENEDSGSSANADVRNDTLSALILRSDRIADVIASRRMARTSMVRDGRFRALLTMRMKMRIPDHPLTRMSGMTPSAPHPEERSHRRCDRVSKD